MKTPQLPYPDLAAAIGLTNELYLKREDLHNYGSHKGRSIPLMIKEYLKLGSKKFVISSSGNAAVAAAIFTAEHNRNNPCSEISLEIFIGKNIRGEKRRILDQVKDGKNIFIKDADNPKQLAFLKDKEKKAKLIRQSSDDLALKGYAELAAELSKIPNLSAIFIPTSSGTTAQGLGEAFQTLSQRPEIHVVQITTCHPIAELFDKNFEPARVRARSIADAIVDRVAKRKDKVAEIIKNSNGNGWVVTDEEIETARRITEENADVAISPNSALAVAGLQKAVRSEKKWNGAIVCLITGR